MLESHQAEFIEFLLKSGALKIGGEHKLKSGRYSPYFLNLGSLNDGPSSSAIGKAYANAMMHSRLPFKTLVGVPEKAVGLERLVASELYEMAGYDTSWFFTRKQAKEHGEATGVGQSKEDRRKALIVGRIPEAGEEIVLLDDVLTTGDAKYKYLDELKVLLEDPKFKGLFISVDRQEVGIDGVSAIETFSKITEIPVFSITTTSNILEYLRANPEGINPADIVRMENYLRVYGNAEARAKLQPLEQRVIDRDRSVVVACDITTLESFEELVKQTADIDAIGGYKIGFSLGLRYGLSSVAEVARRHTNKKLIYDHQKAGTDIPDTGEDFAVLCKEAGFDAVILFPQAGPETERAWIYRALDQGLGVIVGGRMTHAAYALSEGGFVTDEGAREMYLIAARAGVNNFVVPGNKPDVIKSVREAVTAKGCKNPVFYSPGFVAQGGNISDAAKAAGDNWHAIVGRGIYKATDIRAAALEHTRQI